MYTTKDTDMAKTKSQIDKFKQAARDLEADDSEKRFNERLGKIAKQKPGALLPAKRQAKKRKA
jgi:hypothetical protein